MMKWKGDGAEGQRPGSSRRRDAYQSVRVYAWTRRVIPPYFFFLFSNTFFVLIFLMFISCLETTFLTVWLAFFFVIFKLPGLSGIWGVIRILPRDGVDNRSTNFLWGRLTRFLFTGTKFWFFSQFDFKFFD